LIGYFLRHAQVLLASLGQLARAPGSTLMTVCAIGITLALPTLLYLLVDNIETMSRSWGGRVQVSIFLKQNVSMEDAQSLQQDVLRKSEIQSSQLITADQALAEFKTQSGFGRALDLLGENPLPASIVVRFNDEYSNPAIIEELLAGLQTRPEVDFAQWDMAWVQRLYVILKLVQRAVFVLAALLGLAVVIIISNTIRLAILSRRDEIEIMKLIGATDRFIRRPFLYGGAIQGLLGALLAMVVVSVSLQLLDGPVVELVALYRGNFVTSGISGRTLSILLVTGCGLGWLAARATVGRYLRQIEPK